MNNILISTWESRGKKYEISNVLWGEISYKKIVPNNCLNINFTNRGERLPNTITAIHDLINLKRHYKYQFKMPFSIYLKDLLFTIIERIWMYWKLHIKIKYSRIIVTVSETSKSDIVKYLGVDPNNIVVIGNGWEHLLSIKAINEKKDIRIIPRQYYFALGNVKPHKNFSWILNAALLNPSDLFVIAGKIPSYLLDSLSSLNNVIILGYISDSYMKYLMQNAKALLFPSFDEGFGIPPLEALAVDTPCIVSDIPIMHEIFGDAVTYINPYNSTSVIPDVKSTDDSYDIVEKLLQTHSWDSQAKKWFELIESALNK